MKQYHSHDTKRFDIADIRMWPPKAHPDILLKAMNHYKIIQLLTLLCFTVSCSNQKTVIVKSDYGHVVPVKKSTDFFISLTANPSTGYSWETLDIDSSIIRQKTATFTANDSVPGSSGTTYLTFTTIKRGKSLLKLGYMRSWEGKGSIIDSFEVVINVR